MRFCVRSAMQEFLDYFVNHMPTNDQWIAFILVNIVAYVAARNTVLRQERKQAINELERLRDVLESERRYLSAINQNQHELILQGYDKIEARDEAIKSLHEQINKMSQLHDN